LPINNLRKTNGRNEQNNAKTTEKSITDIYLAWEKPEEHVAIKCFIDSKEAGVA